MSGVRLVLRERAEADPARGWVPTLSYAIVADGMAVFVATVDVPEQTDLFARGDRVMWRYRLGLA